MRPYQSTHVEVLYKRGNWKSWDQMIQWLERQGASDDELEKNIVEATIQDLKALRDADVPFSPDHEYAFTLVNKEK